MSAALDQVSILLHALQKCFQGSYDAKTLVAAAESSQRSLCKSSLPFRKAECKTVLAAMQDP